ncbi:hypothetical protein T05_11974 [Trichinella murrelli]|uniref:Uncharacterized protein n=1 Tax=Trichinella murrelli TaxID=144512 RepID=A0A0V0TCB8_9BILA|nr:hypothetical protein T05_11974 [Trichinella murrelli]
MLRSCSCRGRCQIKISIYLDLTLSSFSHFLHGIMGRTHQKYMKSIIMQGLETISLLAVVAYLCVWLSEMKCTLSCLTYAKLQSFNTEINPALSSCS